MSAVHDPKEALKTIRQFEATLFDHALERTAQRVGRDFFDWSEHFDNVFELLQSIPRKNEPARANSLVIFRMMELFRNLPWIHHAVVRGAYHESVRELRYLLEAMVHAYVVDALHPDDTMEIKFATIVRMDENREAHGRALFIDRGVPEESALYALYQDLCKYSHPTAQELAPAIAEGKVGDRFTFGYDEDHFQITKALTQRTMDALLVLILSKFPDACQDFARKEVVMQSLRDLKQERALDLIDRLTAKTRGTRWRR